MEVNGKRADVYIRVQVYAPAGKGFCSGSRTDSRLESVVMDCRDNDPLSVLRCKIPNLMELRDED